MEITNDEFIPVLFLNQKLFLSLNRGNSSYIHARHVGM